MKIGYIGIGIMGRPCVLNLLKAQHEVSIWARRKEAAQDLLQAGAKWANTPAQLATQVDILITNVADSADVEQVLLGEQGAIHGAKPGLICIDMSTIAPNAARRIAAQLAAANLTFLDCPVSGGEVGAINGTLTIMVGGEAAALERAMPALQAMGQTITHIGASGAGQVAKACNQIAVGIGVMAVAEVMKLARACDVDPAPVRAALLGGFAQSKALEVHGQRMIDDNYTPGFKAKLHAKDMRIVLETAREQGIQLNTAQRMSELIEQLIQQGEGELDSSAIARLIWQE